MKKLTEQYTWQLNNEPVPDYTDQWGDIFTLSQSYQTQLEAYSALIYYVTWECPHKDAQFKLLKTYGVSNVT